MSSAVVTASSASGTKPVAGSDRRTTAVVLLILTLAAALRVIGLGYGLPAVYNPDEVAIMSRALAFGTGDLNPHNFLYPTFYFYMLFGWIGLFFVAARVGGAVSSLADFQRSFFVDPTNIYLAGRMFSVVAGVATVAVIYALARRLLGRTAAVAAALFLAVAPIHVRDSHYVKHDVPATLAIAVAYLVIATMIVRRPNRISSRSAAIAAGAACGVAFATHYYAIFLVLPLALALWWDSDSSALAVRRAFLAGVSAAVVFFVLSPFVLAEPATAWRDIAANREIVVDRALAGRAGWFPSAAAYVEMLWRDAVGWPVVLLAAGGAIHLLVASPRVAILLLAFPVAFFLFITNTVPASRYINPLLPALVLFAGHAVAEVAPRWRKSGATTAGMIAIAAALPGAAASLETGRFFRQTDTRTLAQRFIEREVPAGSTVLVQPYSVQLTQSREGLIEALRARLGDERRASIKFRQILSLDPYPSPAFRTIFLGDGGLDADKIYVSYAEVDQQRGLSRLDQFGVRYVVLKREPNPIARPIRARLRQDGRLMAVFLPYATGTPDDAAPEPFLHNTDARVTAALERPGPIIEIWSLTRGDVPARETRSP